MNKANILKLALLLCAVACSVGTGTLLAFFSPEAPSNLSQRTLTFAERVAYQRAIETFGADVSSFQDEEAVAKIAGIGNSIALKFKELAKTGSPRSTDAR